mmetsp:Transcript_20721/g.23280  ORF Transcript_20721/g.23280 Transcript_20721/m.23280 type:complete len:81 (+) Transcript_20721:139-381(+)
MKARHRIVISKIDARTINSCVTIQNNCMRDGTNLMREISGTNLVRPLLFDAKSNNRIKWNDEIVVAAAVGALKMDMRWRW